MYIKTKTRVIYNIDFFSFGRDIKIPAYLHLWLSVNMR